MKKRLALLFTFCVLCAYTSYAQCAMCRAVLESEEGKGMAQGINNGIVYLMLIPYILVAGVGIVIYLKFFRKKKT